MLCLVRETDQGLELKTIREKLGLTIRKFAERLDVPEARYKNWEYGVTKGVPSEVLSKARGFKIYEEIGTVTFTHTAGGIDILTPTGRTSAAGTPLAPIPIVGAVAAGEGINNVDPPIDTLYVPQRLADIGGLGWIIDGDSMMPKLQPGDIAIFREMRTPRAGYPFLVEGSDRAVRVKVLEWMQGQWFLRSLNPLYEPSPMDPHDRVHGILVGWYRSRGTRETMDSDPSGLRLD